MTDDTIHDPTTQGLIDGNPVLVRYQPRKRVAVAGGGLKWQDDGPVLPPQQGSIVFRGNLSDEGRRTLPDGRVVIVQGTVVHLSTGNVQPGWIANVGADRWEVVRVIRRFDVRAEVISYASGP